MANHVSVVVPTYDRPALLERALTSVAAQTHPPAEVIVVDDHSPTPVSECIDDSMIDDTALTIHRHEENRGGSAARETGMGLASGDLIAFLDDDDQWRPTKLATQVDRLRDTDAGVVYTGVEQVSQGETVATKTPGFEGDIVEALLRGNFIGTFSTILLRAPIVDVVGTPDDRLPSWQDWDYYLRLAQATNFAAVPQPLVRRHDDGQAQISDQHASKRDVSAPTLWSKHETLADRYDSTAPFRAAIEVELGWSAILAQEYPEARRHLVASFLDVPTMRAGKLLVLTIGGRYTFEPAQACKRAAVALLSTVRSSSLQ